MFFPLVVLVAVLPGLAALNSWDLTPPGPLWGLRALAVLDGLAIDQVPAASEIKPASESPRHCEPCRFSLRSMPGWPPLGMRLSADRNPLASVLPSYVAGAVVVILVYLHGRLWRGGGMGLAAAILIGFNPDLAPENAGGHADDAGAGGGGGGPALLRLAPCGPRASRCGPGPGPGPSFWAVAGGLSLGLSLLTLEGFGLIVIPVVILHQVYLRAGHSSRPVPRSRTRPWWLDWRHSRGVDRRPSGPGDRPARGASLARSGCSGSMAGRPRPA